MYSLTNLTTSGDDNFTTVLSNNRAVEFQELLGSVGGYIGLILGYTILQIPELIAMLFAKVKTLRFKVVGRREDLKGNTSVLTSTDKVTNSNTFDIECGLKTEIIETISIQKQPLFKLEEKFESEVRRAILEINNKIDAISQDRKNCQ